MPKEPVLDREGFYDVMKDGTIKMLDWNLVNTEVGACLEPRAILVSYDGGQVDIADASLTRLSRFNEDKFSDTFNGGGNQLPIDY